MDDLAETAFRAHYDDVLRFLRRRTRTEVEAEELAQAVFVDAVAGLRAFVPGETPVLAWLYTVAQRRLVDEARRLARRGQPVEFDELDAAPAAEYGPSVARALGDAIAALDDDRRRVVVMRLLEGFSFREIARILNSSEAACRMRFTRALRDVRRSLAEEGLTP